MSLCNTRIYAETSWLQLKVSHGRCFIIEIKLWWMLLRIKSSSRIFWNLSLFNGKIFAKSGRKEKVSARIFTSTTHNIFVTFDFRSTAHNKHFRCEQQRSSFANKQRLHVGGWWWWNYPWSISNTSLLYFQNQLYSDLNFKQEYSMT